MPTENHAPLLNVEPLPDYEPTIGRWLWQLEDTRRETKAAVAGLSPQALTWIPPHSENSIGTLLYHIALIELDWLCVEALGSHPVPEALQPLFTAPDRDGQGHLSVMAQDTLAAHIHRLDSVRQYLLSAFRAMTIEEFRQPRDFPQYRVTPEWALYHIIQHEVEHRGEIQLLRSLAEQALNGA